MAISQFNLLNVTPATAFSVTGLNISLGSTGANGVQLDLLSLTGNDLSQAVRALHTTKKSGGYGRLRDSLEAVDRLINIVHKLQKVCEHEPEPGWCTAVLTNLIVRAKCVSYGRTTGQLRVLSFSPPEHLHTATRRLLAVGALWVEIIGSRDIGKFITACVKESVVVPDELQPELERICSHLGDDLSKSGLGIVHGGGELSMMIGEYVKSKLQETSVVSLPTRCEVVDLLWSLHVVTHADEGPYWTNDSSVFYIYTILKTLSTDIAVQLDYDPNLKRHEVKNLLPRYGKRGRSSGIMDPWLVRCSNDDFWNLMWLHNRLDVGSGPISEYQYLRKVKEMQEMLMQHTKLSPRITDDKGLCSLVSFDSASVPIRDDNMHRVVERACSSILHTDFVHFARVATSVEFFNHDELEAAESLGTSFSVDIGGEEHVLRALDLKLRTLALLVVQTIVMKSLVEVPELVLYTPGMHTSAGKMKGVLRVLATSGSCIQLWRILLVSAWFIGGKAIEYGARERRRDIKDCVGVTCARVTLVLAGVINGRDDAVANNKLWVCSGPVPDLPSSNCGLILVDTTMSSMPSRGVGKTYDQDVSPTQADADVVTDVGPSYGSDEEKITCWIRSDGRSIGFFNPVTAMSRILSNTVECKCGLRGRNQTRGVYRGWPVKMSELVEFPGQLNFQIVDGTATRLIFLAHGNQTWRYCLAGFHDRIKMWAPVIAGDCVACTEEMMSEKKTKALIL